MKHRTIAIIPARAGSKRIKGKNLIELGGKPLIVHTIVEANKSQLLKDNIYVSTDDDTISKVAQKFGAKVLKRPKKLSGDKVDTLDVLKYAIFQLEESVDFDTVVLLQPTSPFRRAATIKVGIEKLWSRWDKLDAIFSVRPSKFPPSWLLKVNNEKLMFVLPNNFSKTRSQDLEKTYEIDGVLYVYKKEFLKKSKSYPFAKNRSGYLITNKNESIDIDDWDDLELARKLAS